MVDPGTYIVREVAGDVMSEDVRCFERLCQQMHEYYTHYTPTHLHGIDFRPGAVCDVWIMHVSSTAYTQCLKKPDPYNFLA